MPRLDVLSAESQLAQDETLMPPLRQELSMARHALAVLVGEAPGNWSPPDFELEDFTPPQTLPVSLPSELARRRPTFSPTRRSFTPLRLRWASLQRISIRRSS
ncbi:MAG: hypothetical protein WDO56_37520 [Gammaproteobacteria bacterium]